MNCETVQIVAMGWPEAIVKAAHYVCLVSCLWATVWYFKRK